MTTLPVEGACRCGQVRMRISAPPMITMACHCVGCRRMTAGPFSLSVMIPAAGFEVIEGVTAIGGLHAPDLRHHHCPHCMSWLFTKVPAADFFVNARATMFDVPAWSTPFIESCVSEKLDWVTTPAVHSFPGFPAMDDYPALMQAYAAQAAG
jgi:hypothetical protein